MYSEEEVGLGRELKYSLFGPRSPPKSDTPLPSTFVNAEKYESEMERALFPPEHPVGRPTPVVSGECCYILSEMY